MPSRLRCFTISQAQFNLTSQLSRAEKADLRKDRDLGDKQGQANQNDTSRSAAYCLRK
jgi:hypothetical protein